MKATNNSIYLKDYSPYGFDIINVNLTFELDDITRVTNLMQIQKTLNDKTQAQDLILDGSDLMEIESILLDNKKIDTWVRQEDQLIIQNPPEAFNLEIITKIDVANNISLEGLYKIQSNKGREDMFCTQCEAQSFSLITFYPDRPDVLSIFTVKIIADTKYKYLLANGNMLETGKVGEDKHYAVWEDPYAKPCYLFAIVVGNFYLLEDKFITASKREVSLRIFVEKHNKDKIEFAMQALKKAFAWDEKEFGLEYDLHIFMLVAVDFFNFGAMENKGLNIFNSKYVLANPYTAEDKDFLAIESVIGHEYFHNWTGNRVTCANWFNLTLKEGLTVFRDQLFSEDNFGYNFIRLDEIDYLKANQFKEADSTLAHPLIPESYQEVNNLYTTTVYQKGAEVVRLYQTLFGKQGFKNGLQQYLEKFDGKAARVEDFFNAMFTANETFVLNSSLKDIDKELFYNWYSCKKTPKITITSEYKRGAQNLIIYASQEVVAAKDSILLVPIQMAVISQKSHKLIPMKTGNHFSQKIIYLDSKNALLLLDQKFSTFRIKLDTDDYEDYGVLSLLRNFSAPVKIDCNYSMKDLSFLVNHSQDNYSSYTAMEKLYNLAVKFYYDGGEINPNYLKYYKQAVASNLEQTYAIIKQILLYTITCDEVKEACDTLYLKNKMLQMPHLKNLASNLIDEINPDNSFVYLKDLNQARYQLKLNLYEFYKDDFKNTLIRILQILEFQEYEVSLNQVSLRALARLFIDYLSVDDDNSEFLYQLYLKYDNMTMRFASLRCIVRARLSTANQALDNFYKTYKNHDLILNKYFSLLSEKNSISTQTIDNKLSDKYCVDKLLEHKDFNYKQPNKIYALLAGYIQNSIISLHSDDSLGYRFIIQEIEKLDKINPSVASNLCNLLVKSVTYLKKDAKERLAHELSYFKDKNLSTNTREIVQAGLSFVE